MAPLAQVATDTTQGSVLHQHWLAFCSLQECQQSLHLLLIGRVVHVPFHQLPTKFVECPNQVDRPTIQLIGSQQWMELLHQNEAFALLGAHPILCLR